MKANGLLDRNWLKGTLGDAMHAVLCGAGHNLRMILAHLRVLLLAFVGLLTIAAAALTTPRTVQHFVSAGGNELFRAD